MKQSFYIVGSYIKDENERLINNLSVSDLTLEYVSDNPVVDIQKLSEDSRAIIGIATITDETKDAFIQSVKTAGIPEGLRNLCITFDWPFDNDYAEFIEAGCQKYGIDPDSLETL